MSNTKHLAMIAAVGPNLELGSHGNLIWHISADLKNFKLITSGHPVIMGRKTWESLPKRPLPGRTNIVLTRGEHSFKGAMTAHSPEEAIALCSDEETPFIIGGEEIYKLFLPLATQLYITHIDSDVDKEVDAWMPEYRNSWTLAEYSDWHNDPNNVTYRFEKWVR